MWKNWTLRVPFVLYNCTIHQITVCHRVVATVLAVGHCAYNQQYFVVFTVYFLPSVVLLICISAIRDISYFESLYMRCCKFHVTENSR